jgi:hypothetical protein
VVPVWVHGHSAVAQATLQMVLVVLKPEVRTKDKRKFKEAVRVVTFLYLIKRNGIRGQLCRSEIEDAWHISKAAV